MRSNVHSRRRSASRRRSRRRSGWTKKHTLLLLGILGGAGAVATGAYIGKNLYDKGYMQQLKFWRKLTNKPAANPPAKESKTRTPPPARAVPPPVAAAGTTEQDTRTARVKERQEKKAKLTKEQEKQREEELAKYRKNKIREFVRRIDNPFASMKYGPNATIVIQGGFKDGTNKTVKNVYTLEHPSTFIELFVHEPAYNFNKDGTFPNAAGVEGKYELFMFRAGDGSTKGMSSKLLCQFFTALKEQKIVKDRDTIYLNAEYIKPDDSEIKEYKENMSSINYELGKGVIKKSEGFKTTITPRTNLNKLVRHYKKFGFQFVSKRDMSKVANKSFTNEKYKDAFLGTLPLTKFAETGIINSTIQGKIIRVKNIRQGNRTKKRYYFRLQDYVDYVMSDEGKRLEFSEQGDVKEYVLGGLLKSSVSNLIATCTRNFLPE